MLTPFSSHSPSVKGVAANGCSSREVVLPTAPILPMFKTVEQMSRISGIGENKLHELMDSGALEYIQNGNRRLIAGAAI